MTKPSALRPDHRPNHRHSSRRQARLPVALALRLIAGSACLAGMLAPTAATAQVQAGHREFDIPAGPLAATVNQIGASAGLLLSFEPALLRGKVAPAIKGRMTAQHALDEVLAPNGLVTATEGGATVIRPAPQSAPAHGMNGATLPTIVVTASSTRELATGPVSGYVATRSATATKTDTPILEIPQSVSVIGRDEIEAKGMRDLLDTLNYTPGVFTRTWGHDDRGYEYMTLRGFQNTNEFTHNYLDALAQWDFIDIGPMTEVYGMERIEVLRGPASAAFGRGDVAGVVHRVSKRPSLSDPVREVQVQAGTFQHRQAAFDYGDRINDMLAFRLVGLGRGAQDQASYPTGDVVKNKRWYFAPSLLWQPSPQTSLTVLASVIEHDAADDVGYLTGPDRQPTHVREGDPRFSRIVQKAATLGYELSHDFSDAWRFKQAFRHADREVDKHHIRPARLQLDGRTVIRGAVHGFGDMQQTSLDSFVEGQFKTGAVQHKLIAGLDWTKLRGWEQERTGTAPNLDLLNPVYLPVAEPTTPGDTEGPYQLDSLGAYVQDQARIAERWLLTLSARHDAVTARGETSYSDPRERTDRAWTGRAGLTWLAPHGWAPYVGYGTSFFPAVGAFDAFDAEPTTGQQWEAGVKYQPPGGKLLFTAAVFDLEKRNVVVTLDGLSQQVGGIRSRGLELELKGEWKSGFSTTASYAYTNVEGLKGNTWYVQEGKTPIMAPKHTASFWLNHAVRGEALKGLSTGVGARYVGRRWDDAANTQSQPDYILFDASLRYDLDAHWRLALNATNVFDKRYYTSNASNAWLRGEERQVTLTAAYRW